MRWRIAEPSGSCVACVHGLLLIPQQELGPDVVGRNISEFAENFVDDWFLARAAGRHGTEIYRAGGPSKRISLLAGKLAPDWHRASRRKAVALLQGPTVQALPAKICARMCARRSVRRRGLFSD
jgi:hypothetical protein